MKRNQIIGLIFGALLIPLIFVWYFFDISTFFSFQYLQKNSAALLQFVQEHYFFSIFLYVSIYVTIIAFSLPATGPLTLLGGFLFGAAGGFVIATLSATIGATVAFLIIRNQVTDVVRQRYGKQLKTFQKKTKKYGVVYLLLMHVSMMIPYIVINILAALSDMRARTIVWTTALGFVPLALIYTVAGSKLTTIKTINDVFSGKMMLVFGVFILFFFLPVIIRRLFGRRLL